MSGLTLPRLELRWTQEDEPDWWKCVYALIFPCHDGRDEHGHGWIAVTLGTTRRGTICPPVTDAGIVETPFRDGVHCRRDAAVLSLPAYAVYGQWVTQIEPLSETTP